jgi:hypothetical protein
MSNYEERLDLRWLVTASEARSKPIYNWFVYPHSFSPGLVESLIAEFGLVAGDRILDPFVGAGTTLLCSKEHGISAVGLDALPISILLTKAKTGAYDSQRLERDIAAIAALLAEPCNKDDQGPLFEMAEDKDNLIARAFDASTIKAISRVKSAIVDIETDDNNRAFLMVGLLALLERFSATRKSGGWLKMIERSEPPKPLIASYLDTLYSMLRDVQTSNYVPSDGEWQAYIGDARAHYPEYGKFAAVISSPPYLNRHDYTRVLSLELLVGFLDKYQELANLRRSLLQSHVEARQVVRPLGYVRPKAVSDLVEQLTALHADPRVVKIVDGYFEDMFAVLKAASLSVLAGGHIAFVLGNVRFSGLSIPVDELVAEMGMTIGLSWVKTLIARYRNNSAQQMRDYGRVAARESVIIWKSN